MGGALLQDHKQAIDPNLVQLAEAHQQVLAHLASQTSEAHAGTDAAAEDTSQAREADTVVGFDKAANTADEQQEDQAGSEHSHRKSRASGQLRGKKHAPNPQPMGVALGLQLKRGGKRPRGGLQARHARVKHAKQSKA